MFRYLALISISASIALPAASQESEAQVYRHYNMGAAEYSIGTESGTLRIACEDKIEGDESQSFFIWPDFFDPPLAQNGQFVISRGSEAITLTVDASAFADFSDHENWETFTSVWNMVRAGDNIIVQVGSHPPVTLATTGAADVMPATPCGE